MTGKPAQEIDQPRPAQLGRNVVIVGRGAIDQGQGLDPFGPQTLKPAHAVLTGPCVVAVGCRRGRYDGHWGGGTAGRDQRGGIGDRHLSAEFGAAFEQEISAGIH